MGGESTSSGARFRGCVNPFWSLDAIASSSWRPVGLYQNEMNQWRGGQQQQLPPRVPFPLWELRFGGDAGDGGCPEGGRDGGGCWHILCCVPYLVPFGLSISQTGLIVCFRAHII